MGAHQSTQSTAYCAPKADDMTNTSSALEPGGNNDAPPPLMPKNATAPVVPAKPAAPMPQLMRQETFEEKLYRKFKAEPLVPIGCLTTAYFLASGIQSFYNRNPAKSQKMMRLRVGSQFATILIFVGYAGMNAFTFDFAPGMASPSDQFPGSGSGKSGSARGGEK